MATALISKFNRQLIISAAARRHGSPCHRVKGDFGVLTATRFEYGQLKRCLSDTNITLVGTTINTRQEQTRSYGTRFNEGQVLQKINDDTDTILPEPSTVKDNVKNVTGVKRAAERGFNAAYADCIHRINENFPPELVVWQTKVFTQNLPLSVLGPQRFGLLVPITYFQSMPTKPTREQMTLAHVLGWSVELLRASNMVTNDTIAINTNLENINRPPNVIQPKNADRQKLTWADKNKLGTHAFNDALTLDQGAQILIRHYFRDDPILLNKLQDLVLETIRLTTLGRSLELNWKVSSGKASSVELDKILLPGGMDMAYYDLNKYKLLIQMKYTFIHYCLPVSMALHLAGIHEPQVHDGARKILQQMSYFSEMYHDFSNCFVDKEGRDIQDGKLTWLIVVACQRANPKQKAILHECYGAGDNGPDVDAKAAAVKKVYKELKIKKALQMTIENTRIEVMDRIQKISKIDNLGLSPEFFFKLMDQMSLYDIS